MEVLKKIIHQSLTTGGTTNCGDNCYEIIPNLNAIYYLKFSLTQDVIDCGFFDVYIEDSYGGNSDNGYGGRNFYNENKIITVNIEPIGLNNLL